AGEKPTFSGKVVGLEPGSGAQVGAISLIGTHWIDNKNYEWAPVNADGSFEVKAELHAEARHAIVVKCDNHPWAFLRAEFEANQSGKNIEITMPADKPILMTVQKSDGTPARSFAVEVFNAYERYDDSDATTKPVKLKAQRYGHFNSAQGELVLPLP